MATTLFLLSFGFNVRRSDEFPFVRRTHGFGRERWMRRRSLNDA